MLVSRAGGAECANHGSFQNSVLFIDPQTRMWEGKELLYAKHASVVASVAD
jgi:hypothetical protein